MTVEPLPSRAEIDAFDERVSAWLRKNASAWWFVSNEGERSLARKLEKYAGRKIVGTGGTRVAFALGRTRVLKVAIWSPRTDRRYTDHNLIEMKTWENASEPLHRLLAPVEMAAEDGRWLVMPRLRVRDENPPRRLVTTANKLGILDVYPWNVGYTRDGKSLIFDYDMQAGRGT